MHSCQHVIEINPTVRGRRVGAPSPRRTARWRSIVCAVAGMVCLATTSAHAAYGVYTLKAAWRGTVANPTLTTLIDFDNLADGTPVSNQYAGLNFAPCTGGNPLAAAERFPNSLFNVLSVDLLPNSAGGGVSIGFARPRHGMAFWYSDSQFAGNFVTIYDKANQALGSYELTFPHPTEWLFVDFTPSNNDIARVDIAMGADDRVTLDNVQFGAAAVPEPSAAMLLLAGAPLFWAIRRRTQCRQASRVPQGPVA